MISKCLLIFGDYDWPFTFTALDTAKGEYKWELLSLDS